MRSVFSALFEPCDLTRFPEIGPICARVMKEGSKIGANDAAAKRLNDLMARDATFARVLHGIGYPR